MQKCSSTGRTSHLRISYTQFHFPRHTITSRCRPDRQLQPETATTNAPREFRRHCPEPISHHMTTAWQLPCQLSQRAWQTGLTTNEQDNLANSSPPVARSRQSGFAIGSHCASLFRTLDCGIIVVALTLVLMARPAVFSTTAPTLFFNEIQSGTLLIGQGSILIDIKLSL